MLNTSRICRSRTRARRKSLRQQTAQPAVEINVDVKAQSLGPGELRGRADHQVAAPRYRTSTLFLVELAYGAVVTVRNVPQELLSAIVLVETPRLMFPFARNIIADDDARRRLSAADDQPDRLRRAAAAQRRRQPARRPAGRRPDVGSASRLIGSDAQAAASHSGALSAPSIA